MGQQFIRIGGAREHNLKNLSVSIPREKLVVFTGPSGSGKSSLVFDTIFAEGRRKYVESLSTYARQFLNQLRKPDVDFIEGLSPAIAIEQHSAASNPRSTIATSTELYDFLRLLFAHIGQAHCPDSGIPICQKTSSDLVDEILALPSGSRLMLLSPVSSGKKSELRNVLNHLAREGFVRARINGEFVEIAGNHKIESNDDHKVHNEESNEDHEVHNDHNEGDDLRIEVIVDRLIIDEKIRLRLSDSIETALKWGKGIFISLHQLADSPAKDHWHETCYSNKLYSPKTGKVYEPLTPRHFSFNSPLGACERCFGLGQMHFFAPDLIVPDPQKSLSEGAIVPWNQGGKKMQEHYEKLQKELVDHYKTDLQTPFEKLPFECRQTMLFGSESQKGSLKTSLKKSQKASLKNSNNAFVFEGVIPHLHRIYEDADAETTAQRLKAFMRPKPCDHCNGLRLKPEILAVRLGSKKAFANSNSRSNSNSHESYNSNDSYNSYDSYDSHDSKNVKDDPLPGYSIMDICSMSIHQAHSFFSKLSLSKIQAQIAGEPIAAIRSRLDFLQRVGLSYLHLDRQSGTLSGGEAQRIRLATQIGTGLIGVLYILDEPSIGLHQKDHHQLLQTLLHLRDMGNSVLVVEHDEETIRQADWVVDMGPGAGKNGGNIVAMGTPKSLQKKAASLTGKYLSGKLSIPSSRSVFPKKTQEWLEVIGACENNLKCINARFPIGALTCVSGVSGSGKSTLVNDVLKRALSQKWHHSKDQPGKHQAIFGDQNLGKILTIDQSPLGRTSRSNPATFTGIFHHIRDLFSKLPAARIRGFAPSRFSFNVKGGRCEKCQGEGLIRIDMQFLPPVYVNCESCEGKRYNRQTLEISYKGRNIAEVLSLTIDEAMIFFRGIPKIRDLCKRLAEVGLGYLQLGQQATTLSGGEAQRVKIAAELGKKSIGQSLYILDEPTTGLHASDVATLLKVLFRLRDEGNTLIVIEHHLGVIQSSDWVIDLGPNGGNDGGEIVATGTPFEISKSSSSHTGQYLNAILKSRKCNRSV